MSRDKIFGRMGNQPPRPPSIALDRMGKLIEAGHLVMFHAEEDLVFEVVSVGPVLHPGAPAGQAIQIMLAAQFPVMTQAATPNRGFVIVGESKTRLEAQAAAANNGNAELQRGYEDATNMPLPMPLGTIAEVPAEEPVQEEQAQAEQRQNGRSQCHACGDIAGAIVIGEVCANCGDGIYQPVQD